MTAVDAPARSAPADDSERAAARSTGPDWRRRLLVGALFVALVLVMIRPTPGSLGEPFVDLGDPLLLRWSLSWSAHTIFRDPLHLFDANIFWPHASSLAYTDSLLVLVPPFLLLRVLGASQQVAFNLVVLGLYVVALAGTYSLARWLTGRTGPAIVAAIAFTFGGYSLAHISHAQLLLLGLFPVGFLLLFRLLDERTTTNAVLFGLVNVAVLLGALYYAAIYVVCVAVIVAGYLVARKLRPGAGLVRGLVIAGSITLLAVPFLWPYFSLGRTRPLVPEWGLKPVDLVTPAFGSYLYGGLDAHAATRPARVEHTFFAGFAMFVLGAIGLAALIAVTVTVRRRRAPAPPPDGPAPVVPAGRTLYVWLLVAAAAVSVVLALGPEVAGVTMPFRFFHDHVPGFAGIRVASRLAVPGLLALAVLAALGFGVLTRRWRHPTVTAVATVVVAGFVLLELAAPITHVRLPTDHATVAAYEALEHEPDGAVVELPIPDPAISAGPAWAFVEAPRMVYSTDDWKPRFNGYSGDFPDEYVNDLRQLNAFPAPDALAAARRLRIRYVILHLGSTGGFPQLGDDAAAAMIRDLPPGARAERRGRAWLVDLGPARR
ncbi:MAG TPA: hypothetical protein VKE97_02975 [Acidimicrobiia bacterium]|nr:hypothetical protein [Acidimicrobiia bacterium]